MRDAAATLTEAAEVSADPRLTLEILHLAQKPTPIPATRRRSS